MSLARNFILFTEFQVGYGSNLLNDAFLKAYARTRCTGRPMWELYRMKGLARGMAEENVLLSFADRPKNVANVNRGQNGA